MKVKDLWVMYLAEQQIEMDYAGIGQHCGYSIPYKIRVAMTDKELKLNYYQWCEKKLLNKSLMKG